MARLTLRVDLAPRGAVGPGKIRLLELVETTGSISAAGRAMAMSYRRAWRLVDELNRMFVEPVVWTSIGGRAGGGAALTPFGRNLVLHYRQMEAAAGDASSAYLEALERALAAPGAAKGG
jgi:molybdate transport system regulatory protein